MRSTDNFLVGALFASLNCPGILAICSWNTLFYKIMEKNLKRLLCGDNAATLIFCSALNRSLITTAFWKLTLKIDTYPFIEHPIQHFSVSSRLIHDRHYLLLLCIELLLHVLCHFMLMWLSTCSKVKIAVATILTPLSNSCNKTGKH